MVEREEVVLVRLALAVVVDRGGALVRVLWRCGQVKNEKR